VQIYGTENVPSFKVCSMTQKFYINLILGAYKIRKNQNKIKVLQDKLHLSLANIFLNIQIL
jgi:hypothetical protein